MLHFDGDCCQNKIFLLILYYNISIINYSGFFMKKLFLFSLLAVVLAACSDKDDNNQDQIEEIEYESLGMGWMTDDMITDLLDWKPVTYQVEILQAKDKSPFYRVVAPYGKAFAEALEEVNGKVLTEDQYDSEGKCYIDIDATDPDNVIFHKTMTGFDIGAGEVFIGINSRLNVTFKDGVFRAPLLAIAVGIDNSAIAANRRGKFRIVLPGIELNDFAFALTPESQCLTERTFKANLETGADIDLVRYAVVPDLQEDEMISCVEQIAAAGAEFTERGDFSYEMDMVNKETLILVAFNAAGEQVAYDWCTYYFIDEDPDGWTDCGKAEFTDGFLQDLIENIPSQTTECMMQESKSQPGRYRLVDPYAGINEYDALSANHKDHHHYIYINACDPECIYIEESPIGMESSKYGLMRVNSFVNYFLGAGYDLEECKEFEMGAIVEDGVITFPEEALLFSMLKYEDGDWMIADSEGVTSIKLPEGVNLESAAAAPARSRAAKLVRVKGQSPKAVKAILR